jgi:hypothetical protein
MYFDLFFLMIEDVDFEENLSLNLNVILGISDFLYFFYTA